MSVGLDVGAFGLVDGLLFFSSAPLCSRGDLALLGPAPGFSVSGPGCLRVPLRDAEDYYGFIVQISGVKVHAVRM